MRALRCALRRLAICDGEGVLKSLSDEHVPEVQVIMATFS